jgi:hypothetical protein
MPPWGSNTQRYNGKTQEETRNTGVNSDDGGRDQGNNYGPPPDVSGYNAAPPTTNYGAPPDVSGYNAAPPVITPPIQDNKVNEESNEDSFINNTITSINPPSPDMQTGFGSWFGANSGSTGSSLEVQNTIQSEIDKALDIQRKLYKEGKVKVTDPYSEQFGQTRMWTKDTKNQIIKGVMRNLYPSLPVMGIEEFLDKGGKQLDYDLSSMFTGYDDDGGTGNLMGIPPGQVGIDTLNFDKSFDENWGGGQYWDDYLGEYYGPSEKTDYSKMKRWDQRSLGEILQEGPTGFGDLQRIYGEELTDTSANPFAAVAAYNKKGSYTPSFGETITEYIA